jgi:hypothetical protein
VLLVAFAMVGSLLAQVVGQAPAGVGSTFRGRFYLFWSSRSSPVPPKSLEFGAACASIGPVTEECANLDQLAQEFASARAELADLRSRMLPVQETIARLKPQVTAAIVDDVRSGRRTQLEISRLTGYTPERIRQLCRAAGVDPA